MSRSWEPRAIAGVDDGLILFDGACAMCSSWVRFVFQRDASGEFRFAPIQSPYGRSLALALGIDPETPETNAVILGGRAYFKSDATIRVLARLPSWRWSLGFALVPRLARNWAYDQVARNRYHLFGSVDPRAVTTSEIRARLVVEDPRIH